MTRNTTPVLKKVLAALCLLLIGGMSMVKAQQIEVAYNHFFNPYWTNPAHVMNDNLTRVSLLHQHRNLAGFGWRSMSQFLDFKSKPIGARRTFGWGINLSNDVEHTEQRLAFGFNFGAKLIQTEVFDIGLGINLGFLNWGSRYEDIPVYHQGDPRLGNRVNFSELDAGAGIAFKYQNYLFRASVDGSAKQLPGSFLSSDPIKGTLLIPHAFASGKFLFAIGPDMYLGPWGYYRNTFSRDELVAPGYMQNAWADVGAKFEMDLPKMWAGVGYRFGDHPVYGFGSAGIMTNFGIEIKGTDTTDSQERIASFLDLVFSASYPLNSRAVFGPTVEIGLALAIGKVGSDVDEIDTVGLMRGAFWVNSGNMDTHKERYLKDNGPTGLYAESAPGAERVYLTYEWNDNFYMYKGENMKQEDKNIAFLGDDWIGVDGILENMVGEVIAEALNPVHMDVSNPDSVEPLKDLISIGLQSKLRFDQLGADFGAEGMIYGGELGFNNETNDTLHMPILYDDRDTIVSVYGGKAITNLELACLKIYAMSKKLEYELNKYYNNKFALVSNVDAIFDLEDKKVVLVKTPTIIPNNPNQQPFQVSVVNLGFNRDVNWKPTIRTTKTKRKGNIEQVRTKRDRNGFRDPVGEDEN
jgi:hypothetical protein